MSPLRGFRDPHHRTPIPYVRGVLPISLTFTRWASVTDFGSKAAAPVRGETKGCNFARLGAIHAAEPLDAVLVTGDVTDARRSAEWAEFFAALAPYLKAWSVAVGCERAVETASGAASRTTTLATLVK